MYNMGIKKAGYKFVNKQAENRAAIEAYIIFLFKLFKLLK